MSETRFKNQLKDKVNSDSSIYPYARSLYRLYCNIAGPFHVLPNFIIFGVSRSGTTSLYQYLAQHPNIEPCVIKEPRYFDMYYDRGLNWYRMNFPLQTQKFISNKFRFKKQGIEWYPRYLPPQFAVNLSLNPEVAHTCSDD